MTAQHDTMARLARLPTATISDACAGSTLRAARQTFGYHTLQTRQP